MQKSFPLLELLVVVAIAFPAHFLLPALSKVRALGCTGNMKQLQSGMLSCAKGSDDFSYPTTIPPK